MQITWSLMFYIYSNLLKIVRAHHMGCQYAIGSKYQGIGWILLVATIALHWNSSSQKVQKTTIQKVIKYYQ